jgi:hypothetical protein
MKYQLGFFAGPVLYMNEAAQSVAIHQTSESKYITPVRICSPDDTFMSTLFYLFWRSAPAVFPLLSKDDIMSGRTDFVSFPTKGIR